MLEAASWNQMNSASQYNSDKHRHAVVEDDNWDSVTNGGKFHAMLTTSSIPETVNTDIKSLIQR